MKMLLKQSGIIIMFIGILILSYAFFGNIQNNSVLLTSLLFVIFGLVIYIAVNNYID
jgi:hypothetical protein